MNFDPRILKNTYFVLRHGTSEANVAGIILSDPVRGIPEYGLTSEGKIEVQTSAEKAKTEGILDESTVIVSSDFKRAKETAEIAAKVLGVNDITFTTALHERFFGEWEETSNAHYEKVWEKDAVDSHRTENAVESAEEVLKRTLALIDSLEKQYVSKNILLVSHGDTLQILQTAFESVPVSGHRSLAHLNTAEIRQLNWPQVHAG